MSQLPIEERLIREKQVQNFAREQAAKEKEEEELANATFWPSISRRTLQMATAKSITMMPKAPDMQAEGLSKWDLLHMEA